MPSNKELTAEAEALAAELDLTVETEGLKNDQLADLVSDLKAKKTDADTDTGADDAEDKATAEAQARAAARKAGKPAQTKKPEYYVAPRKSLTSKKGILSGDTEDEVKAEYLAGGNDALQAFVKSGHVLKG